MHFRYDTMQHHTNSTKIAEAETNLMCCQKTFRSALALSPIFRNEVESLIVYWEKHMNNDAFHGFLVLIKQPQNPTAPVAEYL